MTIQEYNDIYKNSITKSMQIESSGGVTITNTNICSEQMSLEEALCSEENLIIGSCESACFKIRIADMNHNFEGETLTVYQMIMVDAGGDLLLESGDSDYILLENGDRISLEMVGVPVPYGKFKVLSDKPTNDRRWRDLTCYDAMYDILNADVAEWYNSLTFPMTIKNFRDRFFNYLGITQDTVTLVNDNFETQGGFSVSGSLSGKDVITSICELNGVFGHISRDGLFEYISLPSADSLALDWYIDGTGAYEDYLVQKITGIVARSSDDDVGTTVGTDTNLYVVEDNPLIYGSEGTASLTTALTNLLNNVKDINYRPFNVDTYGNPMLPLGTNLTITTRNQTINSFLMTRVLSGIQSLKDSISAKGEKYRPTEVNSLRSETKRTKGIIHELVNDVDELRSTIIDLDNQTSSEIQQLSNEIVLKVDASGNIVKVALASNASEGSTFAVNADNIRFTAGSVMRFDANNIVINSTYFKVDQYGNLQSTSGKIGGWDIRTSGLSKGMLHAGDFSNTGIFLSSGGRIVINDANTHTNSRIDKNSYSIIRNDIGANAYVGYISNSVGFGFEDAYGNQVHFSGTALNLGCVKDGTSVISNVRFEADPFSIILYGGDTGYANKIISLTGGFRDNSWTNEKVTYVDTYKGLQTCDTTKTEVEYVHGVTSNIQTQLDGKQATITGGATTIVSDNLTASKALVSNANGKVAVSSVTATELGYLSGVTSNVQTQLDSKISSANGAISTVVNSNLTASRALVSNSSGKIAVSSVTSTELGYLSGVTSNIQTQLDSKISAANGAISTVVSSNLTASRALISNANGKIAVSSITSTKLGYLTDVTSNIQSQIDGKQASITGAATTITSSNLTTSRALISNSSGKVAVSSVTSTELGYLSGVTSNIQTQLDSKISSANGAISTVVNSNLTTSRALISNSSGKIAVSATTSTELGYLSGVTSNVQTQLNGKQSTISGGATTITSSNLTTNRALVSNSSGKVAVSTTTATELGYLSGATSNIQTQLDSKANKAHIYGVEWDGSSTTKWIRTDDSQYFVDPQSAINNGNGFSPFDNIYPWAGMVIINDATAGTLVSIPKFWYKWTKNGSAMKLQIADAPVDGFHVSPAHMNRGDGKGERDVVYVGRYHCASTYKSTSGVAPIRNKTRSECRTSIGNLGSTIWQMDYAMIWTIRMLYLVEYANWNSQATIGYGCGNGSSVVNTGYTDSMVYCSGTTQASKTTYGNGTQYRHIEGLWENVFDWCDGIYFNGTNVYGILNPSNFSDTQNGTFLGTRPITDSYATAMYIPSANGFDWALYPSAGNGSANTYITDGVNFAQNGVCLAVGSLYYKALNFGLFFTGGDNTISTANNFISSRLMVLP